MHPGFPYPAKTSIGQYSVQGWLESKHTFSETGFRKNVLLGLRMSACVGTVSLQVDALGREDGGRLVFPVVWVSSKAGFFHNNLVS